MLFRFENYAPASPVFAEKVSAPGREVLQEGVKGQYATLEQQIDAYIQHFEATGTPVRT